MKIMYRIGIETFQYLELDWNLICNEVIHLICAFATITGLPNLSERIDLALVKPSVVNGRLSIDFWISGIKNSFRYANFVIGFIACCQRFSRTGSRNGINPRLQPQTQYQFQQFYFHRLSHGCIFIFSAIFFPHLQPHFYKPHLFVEFSLKNAFLFFI